MQTFKPIRDRVLVMRLPTEEMIGRILVPHTAQEKPIEGEIKAVGTGTIDSRGVLHAVEVKVGDRILFGKFAGTEIKLNNEDHLILREDEILGVLTEPKGNA